MYPCDCVCVCVHIALREKVLMNKGLNCERDKLTLRDIWRNTFIVSPAENKYQVSWLRVQRDTVLRPASLTYPIVCSLQKNIHSIYKSIHKILSLDIYQGTNCHWAEIIPAAAHQLFTHFLDMSGISLVVCLVLRQILRENSLIFYKHYWNWRKTGNNYPNLLSKILTRKMRFWERVGS